MVLRSDDSCSNPIEYSSQLAGSLSRIAMQERELIKPTTSEDVLGCSTGSRPKFKPQIGTDNNQTALRCPRCDSNNTKFCYYNNYSLLQPRYFCKSCRRYWTKGGALRNVPVGGGCRKNKRISRQRTPSEIPPTSNHMFSSPLDPICTPFFSFDAATSANLSPTNPSLSLMQPSGSPAANLVYFNLPTDGIKDGGNNPLQQLIMRPSSTDHHQQNAGLFSRQLASYLPSALASQYLSNVGALPFHNAGFNPSSDNDYLAANSAGEQFINSSYIQANPHVPATGTDSNHKVRFKAFNLGLDNHNTTDQHHPHHHHNEHIWAESPHEQKLLAGQKISHMAAMENQAIGGPSRYTQLRPNLSPKVEEGWQGQAEASTSAADQGANFWNNGGWNDIPGYNPGADHSLM